MSTTLVDLLAQEIRRVDGNHDLGAGALAEALLPFLAARERETAERGGREVRERVEAVIAARGAGDFSPMIPKLREIANAGGEPE